MSKAVFWIIGRGSCGDWHDWVLRMDEFQDDLRREFSSSWSIWVCQTDIISLFTCTFFIDYEISLVFNLYSIRNYCWATSKFNESCTHAFNSHLHKFRGTTIQRCYSLSGLLLRANYRLYCMENMLTRDYFQMNFKVCHRTSIITGKRVAINSY